MKLVKFFKLGTSVVLCAVFFTSFAYSADKGESKRVYRDVPWVSLAHQRELARKAQISKDSNKVKELELTQKKSSNEDDKKESIWNKFSMGSRPELSADKFEYADDGSGNLVAKGNAKITDKNFEVDADSVSFSQTNGIAKATGDVRLTLEPVRLLSENLDIDMNNDSLKSGYSRFGAMPILIESESMEASRKGATFKGNRIYFNEPSFAGFNATCDSVSYNAETDVLTLEESTFKIGQVPFLYTPSYSQKGLSRPPIYLKNEVGYNSDNGAYIANTVQYTGFENIDVGGLLDYYTKRSVLFGPAVNYEFEGSELESVGWFQAAYINDQASKSVLGVDSFGRPIERDRFFIEWRNNSMLNDNLGFVANVSYWSDEFVTRDFRDQLYYDNQTPDNFAELAYYGDFYIASLFTRFRPNDWETVQQRLPEVRFDMVPVEILQTGAYQTMYMSYGYLRGCDAYSTADFVDSNRFDAYYGISRPIQLNSWSKFTPVIGARATYYADAINGSSDYARFLGQIGFDAQMDIWGHFDFKSETMGIDGIRHHITPILSYRFIPNAQQGENRIPQVDTYYLSTYPQVLDLAAMRNTDQLYNTNTMRFGIRNVFETRDSEYGSREIGRFDVFQDVNFDNQPLLQQEGLQSFSDLYINASVNPARWLTMGVYNRINLDHIDIPEVNTYIGLLDGDAMSIYLISTYLENYLTQYSVWAEYRISERYKVFGRWAYDYKNSMLTDQTYGLWTRMGSTWIIEYLLSYRTHSTRQNGLSVGVRVSVAMF